MSRVVESPDPDPRTGVAVETSDPFRSFLEFAPDAVVIIDAVGRIELINAQTERLFGYGRDELVGEPVETLLPPRFRNGHISHRAAYLHDPRPRAMGAGLELFGQRKDGTEFPVDISLSPLQTERGVLLAAAIRDVTERARAEEARRHLAAIVEYSDDAIIGKTLDGVITSWNRGAQSLYGHTAEEAIGQNISILAPDDQEDEVPGLLERVRHGEGIDHYETRRMRKDGTIVDVSVAISPVRDASGAITGASVVGRDITSQKRAQEKFRSFVESAPDALVIIDPRGVISLVNAQTEALFGYRREDMLGQPVELLLPERFRPAHVGHRIGYLAEPRTRPMGAGLELFGRRADGGEFPVDISLSPLDTEEGLLLAATIRDVTERTRLERIREEFIANAAHELRTPLTTLSGVGEMLALHLHELSQDQLEQSLAALKRQGERASVLVSNLLDLSQVEGGRALLDIQDLNVASAAKNAVEVAPAPEGTSVEISVDDGTSVHADPVRFQQILTNLLTNAYRYGGRNVTIDARSEPAGVIVSVSDDGSGVPPDLLPNVFEPFTRGRTAGAVGGSGIGLALCRRLVEVFGGSMWYETAQPHGARFVVRLPRPA